MSSTLLLEPMTNPITDLGLLYESALQTSLYHSQAHNVGKRQLESYWRRSQDKRYCVHLHSQGDPGHTGTTPVPKSSPRAPYPLSHPKAPPRGLGEPVPRFTGSGRQAQESEVQGSGCGLGAGGGRREERNCRKCHDSGPVSFCRALWLPPARPSPCLLHKELLRRGRTNAALCSSQGGSGFVPDSCL